MENQSLRDASVIVERGLICRMCMGNREYSVNIFYCSEVYKIPVCNVMMDLLHVEVSEDDGLPDTVCRRCVRKLLEFKEFKELCLKSATELRKSAKESYFFCPAKDEELGYSERAVESIDATYSTGDNVPITAPSIVTQGLLAVDNMFPVKEEEQRVMEVVAEEEIKREIDIDDGLNSGLTADPNMDPVVVLSNADGRCGQSSFIEEESNKESEVSDLLEIGFSGFDMTSPASGNEIELRKTYLLTLEDEFHSEDAACSDILQRLFFDFEMTIPHTGIEHVKEEDMPCVTEAGATSNDGDNCDVDRSAVTPIQNITSEPIVVNSCNESGDFSRKQGKMPGNVGVMELGTSPNNSTLISRDGHLRQGDDSINNAKSHSLTLMPNSELMFIENRRLTRKSQKCSEIPGLNFSREWYGHGNETVNIAPHEDSVEDHAKYICDYCRITFTDKKSLYLHIEEHTAERMITTEKVSRRVSPKVPQLIISRIDQNFKLLSNGTGEKVLNKVTYFASQSMALKGMLPLDKCGNELNKMNTLAKHRTVHSGTSFKCQVCGKEFYCKTNFVAHTAIHSAERLHKCEVCGMSFNVKRKLVRHSRVHEKPSSFDCNSCGRKFRQKGYLSNHITIRCGKGTDGPFKCDKCGKEFNKKSTSIKHRSVHSGVKFKCELCGKEFYWKSNYISHIVVHGDERPFKCETCGKHFNLKSNLTRHCLVHNDRRPFRCDICGKDFKVKDYLASHMVIHTGVKRFKCEICLKEFTQRNTLKMHSLTHTKLRAFKCESCSTEFKNKYNLIRHCKTYCHYK